MTHFKRAHMSYISNSFYLQVNLYGPVLTTGNPNAANKMMTGKVCGPHKNMHSILLSGTIVSLEKRPVFLTVTGWC